MFTSFYSSDQTLSSSLNLLKWVISFSKVDEDDNNECTYPFTVNKTGLKGLVTWNASQSLEALNKQKSGSHDHLCCQNWGTWKWWWYQRFLFLLSCQTTLHKTQLVDFWELFQITFSLIITQLLLLHWNPDFCLQRDKYKTWREEKASFFFLQAAKV